MSMDHSIQIKETLIKNGADLIGFADIKEIVSPFYKDINSGISIAVVLDVNIVKNIREYPNIEYYREYKRVNDLLSVLGNKASEYLKNNGFKAIKLLPTNKVDDLVDLSTELPHKTLATRAGLGWIGRTALPVTTQYGSALRLTSVLTNAIFKITSNPIDSSRCDDDCRNCVDECPCHAATGDKWNSGMKRSDFFNASRCHATAVERAGKIGIDKPICGKCIAVCSRTIEYIEREISLKSKKNL